MTPLKVLVILGSVRQGRMSERVATFVMARLATVEAVTAELVDLRELNLPIMEERLGKIEPTPPGVAELGAKIRTDERIDRVDIVIAPAIGGIIVAHEVARALGTRALFTEREEGAMKLRRVFKIEQGTRAIVV